MPVYLSGLLLNPKTTHLSGIFVLFNEVSKDQWRIYGRGPGGGGASLLFWVRKEELTEGRKAGWASKIVPGPLVSSKCRSATEEFPKKEDD